MLSVGDFPIKNGPKHSAQGASPGGRVVKNPPAKSRDARDTSSTPGLGRSPGTENGNPLQYSGLGNPIERGAWQTTVHEVTESDMTEPLSTHHAQMLVGIT